MLVREWRFKKKTKKTPIFISYIKKAAYNILMFKMILLNNLRKHKYNSVSFKFNKYIYIYIYIYIVVFIWLSYSCMSSKEYIYFYPRTFFL